MTGPGKLCDRCGELHHDGKQHRCPDGRPTRAALRESVYADPRWRKTRRIVFQRDAGRCQSCGGSGKFVDHKLPIETLIELGRSPFNATECQLLCPPCSGAKDGGRR